MPKATFRFTIAMIMGVMVWLALLMGAWKNFYAPSVVVWLTLWSLVVVAGLLLTITSSRA